MSQRSRAQPLLVAAFAAASLAAPALAAPASRPAGCEGQYSLTEPLPGHCLEEIEADRPHLTDTPHPVAPGHVQLEVGLAAWAARRGGAEPIPQAVDLLDLVVKAGLWNGIDLHLGWAAVGLTRGADGRFTAAAGGHLLLRAKIGLLGHDALVGRRFEYFHLTLAPALLIPLRDDNVAGGAFLLAGAVLPGELDLEVNLGLVREPEGAGGGRGVLVPAVALTRRIVGPLAAYVEHVGQVTRPRAPVYGGLVAGGLVLALGAHVKLDAGVRVGLRSDLPPVVVFTGFTVRR